MSGFIGNIGPWEIILLFNMLLLSLPPIFVFILPSFLAYRSKHPKFREILLVNILLGWTIIGWIVALFWAIRKTAERASSGIPGELLKLAELKDSGVITDEEFQNKKTDLLSRM